MRVRFLLFILLSTQSTIALAQISSPPPISGKTSGGGPLSEVFTPESLFPKKSELVPVKPKVIDEEVVSESPPTIKLWAGSGDFGVNGAYGNSNLMNIRGGWNVRRKSEDNALTSDFQYVFSQQNGIAKTSQALFNIRDEILFPEVAWSPFGAAQVEYDEFRSYRFRVGVYAGTGYRIVDEKDLTFKVRFGAGATREIGVDGVPDRWVPEFLLGYDFRYRINERSTLISILDFYPRINDVRQFRARGRIAYEYLLDPELGLLYRIGVQDRYDSDPGNAKPNDVTYFTTLGLKF